MATCRDDSVKPTQQRARHRRVIKPQHRSLSRLVRANAKHLVESGQVDAFPLCAKDHGQMDKACLRNHIERDLRNHYNSIIRPVCPVQTPSKMDYQEEGQDLAYSDVPLPSDRYRLQRGPGLERLNAFREESTSRGRIHVRRRPESANNDDQQVAHLYSMGLLYDSEHDAGSEAFDLNSIRHDEPVYSIRPVQRDRKGGRASRKGPVKPLHVDLSFSDLGDDEGLARYLMAMAHPGADANARNGSAEAAQQPLCQSETSQTPLHVIYELFGSPPPASDIDASQPPDLVTDLLSDYDCVSDGELDDDTPLQREVQEDASGAPADVWVMLGE